MYLLLALLSSPAALADDAAEARAFFDDYVARSAAFDASIATLYAPGAKIVTIRDGAQRLEMDGARWSALMTQVMPMARASGDVSTYEAVAVAPHGGGYRVTAVRRSALKCTEDPSYHLDLEKRDGAWKIVEEHTSTASLTQCKPSKKLAATLKGLHAGVQPHLPIDLDEETRLESVDVEASAIIYRQRLIQVAASEVDVAALSAVLRQMSVQSVCATPGIRDVVDGGGMVRYAYVDRDGALVTNVDVSGWMCTKP